MPSRTESIVALVVVVSGTLASIAVYDARTTMAGHGLTVQCPTASEHCLARQQMWAADGKFIGVQIHASGEGVPCVYASCETPGDYGCGGFSAVPTWIVETAQGSGQSTDAIPEIGIVRFDSEDGGYRQRIYSYCDGCGGASGWGLHDYLRDVSHYGIHYETSTDEWAWWTRGHQSGSFKYVRLATNVGSTGGQRIDSGGETTNWNHDMGVNWLIHIMVGTKSTSSSAEVWEVFSPGAPKNWFYPPGENSVGGRYRTRYLGSLSGFSVSSDHHWAHTEDACGDQL